MQRIVGNILRETAFYAAVAFFVVLATFPFYWMLITSLKSNPRRVAFALAHGFLPPYRAKLANSSIAAPATMVKLPWTSPDGNTGIQPWPHHPARAAHPKLHYEWQRRTP